MSSDLLLNLRRKGIKLGVSGKHGEYQLKVASKDGTRVIPFHTFQALPSILDKLMSDKPSLVRGSSCPPEITNG